MRSCDVAMMTRQIKLDRCPQPYLAVDRRVAVRLPRKSIDHRKPKSGALPDRLGGKERIEGARRHLRAHAHAGVGDFDANIIAGQKRGRVGGQAADARVPIDWDRTACTTDRPVPRFQGRWPPRWSGATDPPATPRADWHRRFSGS